MEKRTFSEIFEHLWSQALVAVSAAEDEVSKAVQKLAEAAGWSQEEARRQVRELSERLVAQRRELNRAVEEGVKKALARVKVPRRDELQDFGRRLDRLAERIQALER
jgi:polyhydroxyalkanoate synthesis regulator phasin